MPPTLLRRLVTPIGVTLALGFIATGVFNIYAMRSKDSVPELILDSVLFFLFMPTLCLWERRKEAAPPDAHDSSPL